MSITFFQKMIFCSTLSAIIFSTPLEAQWPTSPDSPILLGGGSTNFAAISDGQGGAYVSRGNSDVICERLDANGNKPWSSEPLDYLGHEVWFPSLAISSDSGLLISYSDIEWVDYPESEFVRTDIRIQKFDSIGNKLWGTGIVVSPPDASGEDDLALTSRIIGSMDGGAYVAWVDLRDGGPNISLYVQKISSSGEILWSEYGQRVTNSFDQIKYLFLNEFNEVSIIFKIHNVDISISHRIQKFSETGLEYYDIEGLELPTVPGTSYSVNESGTLFYKYSLNRIAILNTNAIPVMEWVDVPLETPGETYIKSICPDVNGGAFITLYDVQNESNNIYYQWIESNGSLAFDEPGLFGATVDINYGVSTLKSNNGFISILNGHSQLAFRINSSGNITWNNVLLYDQDLAWYHFPVAVSDNYGGAVYIFVDEEWGGVRATKVSANGILGATSDIEIPQSIPQKFRFNPYPNPFNSELNIDIEGNGSGNIVLELYDIKGCLIISRKFGCLPNGKHTININLHESSISSSASSIYILKIYMGNNIYLSQVTYLK